MSGFKGPRHTLKSEFKTVNKRVYFFGGLIGLSMVGILALGSAVEDATQADLNGEKVTHANCTINNKQVEMAYINKMLTVTGYEADTSCGVFDTNSDFYESLNKGGTYDLTVTLGNWANKPTLVSAAASGK